MNLAIALIKYSLLMMLLSNNNVHTSPKESEIEKPVRPNVVIILADDLGYGSVGAYGANKSVIQTPAIDRLASEGRMFTNAYTPSSVCSPTRYGLLTGRYDWRTGKTHGVLGVKDSLHIQPNRATIADIFKNAGYNTAAIGKWHLGYQNETVDFYKTLSPGPLDLGFDYHWGVPCNHGDISGVWVENDHVYGMVEKMEDVPEEQRQPKTNSKGKKMMGIPAPYRTENKEMLVLTQKAVDWIKSQSADKPFFLYYPTSAIHAPIVSAPQFTGTSNGGPYGDFIHELDYSVGEVLKAIEEAGFSDNTLVLLTSDNGGHPAGAGEAINAGLKINGDLRGNKLTVWEGGFKVPYIVRWPGHIEAGSTCNEMVNLTDTYMTLSKLLGTHISDKKEAAEDSYNMLPAWLNEEHEQPIRESMVLTSFEGITSFIKGKWKYIDGVVTDPKPKWLTGNRVEEMNEMLFNLEVDPKEENNLISIMPGKAQEMKTELKKIRDLGHSTK